MGLIVAWATLSLRFGTRAEAVYNLGATLDGMPLSLGGLRDDLPYYNRVLFPLLHRALSRLLPFASEGQWYLLLRILSFQVAFAGFALVCHFCMDLPRPMTVLATAVLGLATITTFGFAWEDPCDAFDILGLALGVGAALRGRFLWCLILSIGFAANRESAAFIGIIWFFLRASRAAWLRPAIEGGIMCSLSYGTVIALRLMVAPKFIPNTLSAHANVDVLLNALINIHPLSLVSMLIAVGILLVGMVDLRAVLARRFLGVAALLTGVALTFGAVNEMRVLLPTFVMLSFALAASFRDEDRAFLGMKE